jgi:sugar phosphate isomerase/epimerase
MASVGSGAIDFKRILVTARTQGAHHAFVEHDDAADPLASARASYNYLSRLKY